MFRKFYNWVRFGKIKAVTVSTHNGEPCEIVYTNKKDFIIGYWVYGQWDPYLPYKGD